MWTYYKQAVSVFTNFTLSVWHSKLMVAVPYCFQYWLPHVKTNLIFILFFFELISCQCKSQFLWKCLHICIFSERNSKGGIRVGEGGGREIRLLTCTTTVVVVHVNSLETNKNPFQFKIRNGKGPDMSNKCSVVSWLLFQNWEQVHLKAVKQGIMVWTSQLALLVVDIVFDWFDISRLHRLHSSITIVRSELV